MTGLLLDTNVVSELRKPAIRRHPVFQTWATTLKDKDARLSAVTITELARWVAQRQRDDPAQAVVLDSWLHDFVLVHYAGRIIPMDTNVALIAGPLHVPNPRDYRDTFIAATAIHHGLTIATRNVHDFAAFDVPLINPFEPQG